MELFVRTLAVWLWHFSCDLFYCLDSSGYSCSRCPVPLPSAATMPAFVYSMRSSILLEWWPPLSPQALAPRGATLSKDWVAPPEAWDTTYQLSPGLCCSCLCDVASDMRPNSGWQIAARRHDQKHHHGISRRGPESMRTVSHLVFPTKCVIYVTRFALIFGIMTGQNNV